MTTPLIEPPARRRGPLVAALVLVAVGTGGAAAFWFLSPLGPDRHKTDERHTEVQLVPPTTANNTKDARPEPGDAKKDAKDAVPGPVAQPPVVAPPPPGPPAKAIAKGLAGDRTDLALLRTRGPAVRTGGRGLTWTRRRELFALNPHRGRRAVFAADAGRAAFSTPTDAVLTCSLRDGQVSATSLSELTNNLTDGASHVNAVGLTPDGNRVLLATMGRSEKPLDGNPVTTRYNMLVSWEMNGATEPIYGPRIDLAAGFGCVAIAPDGKEVLVGGALSQIYRWRPGSRDLRTGRRFFKHGTGDVITALTYSSDGRFVASAGMDKLVCVFNAAKAESAPLTTLSGLQTGALTVALSSSGLHALAGGREGKVYLWQVGDEPPATVTKPMHVLQWHDKESAVTSVCFAPSGRLFLTGCDDGTVCLGEVGKDTPVWTEAPRPGGGSILALAVAADGRHVLVADEAGLGEYPLVRDVVARNKSAVIISDSESAPAEAKGP